MRAQPEAIFASAYGGHRSDTLSLCLNRSRTSSFSCHRTTKGGDFVSLIVNLSFGINIVEEIAGLRLKNIAGRLDRRRTHTRSAWRLKAPTS